MAEAYEDKLELAAYKITERMEERFWSNVRSKGLLFLAGLTIFGVVSFPIFFQLVADKVTNNISEKVDRDSEILRNRVNANLADIAAEKADLDRGLKEARSSLDALQRQIDAMQKVSTNYQSDTKKLQDLQGGYENLQSRIEKLSSGVQSATALAETSRLSTVSLGLALTTLNSGQPSIFSAPLSFGPGTPSVISGANFGTSRGRVYIQVSAALAPLGSLSSTAPIISVLTTDVTGQSVLSGSKEIELGKGGIADWTPDKITITCPESVARELREMGNSAKNISFQVETSQGVKSPWSISGFYAGQ